MDQQPVTQSPVADRQRPLAQLVHDRPDDAGAGEDDVGALGLQADDRAARLGVARAVALDLAVDLGPVQDRALDGVGP